MCDETQQNKNNALCVSEHNNVRKNSAEGPQIIIVERETPYLQLTFLCAYVRLCSNPLF